MISDESKINYYNCDYMEIGQFSKIFHSILFNILFPSDLTYIVESKKWAIYWDGYYITSNLKKIINSALRVTHHGLSDGKTKIIHFGSIHTYNNKIEFKNTKCIISYFHLVPNDFKTISKIKINLDKIDIIHTSCSLTKEALTRHGINGRKIKVIPLGVDHKIFKKIPDKETLRQQYGIPLDNFVIGSFQKDGVGWKEGIEPKLVKGPDIFVEVVKSLSQKYDIFVLLTGPARGYVKKRLEKAKVPYKHFFINNYQKLGLFYNMIDVNLITSRAEGGPKSLLESMACGVPVISTRVGMAHDIIENGKNGLIAGIEDVKSLCNEIENCILDPSLRERIGQMGFNSSLTYKWENIANIYYKELYEPLL